MKKFIIFFFFSTSLWSQDTLTFEQPSGTKNWIENSLNWQFIGGSDQIQLSSSNAFTGSSYGRSTSGSGSKLVFESTLTLVSIRVKHTGGTSFGDATLNAFDGSNNIIYTINIQPNSNYQLLNLNWAGVSSIAFDVPYDLFMDPLMPGTPMPFPIDLYFDELSYSSGTLPTCQIPTQTQTSNITSSSVQASWLWESGKKYLVRYKLVSQSTWSYSDTLISTLSGLKPYTITGLNYNGTYEWQVMAICSPMLSSSFSSSNTTTTSCAIVDLATINAVNVTDSSANLSWADFGIPQQFQVWLKPEGTNNSVIYYATDTSGILIDNLNYSTDYQVEIEPICFENMGSNFSAPYFFSTIAPAGCATTYSTIDTVIISTPYISPDGSYYSQEGAYAATISNTAGCDSIITINILFPTISQALIVDFEEPSGTSLWNEDGLQWEFIGGTDQIQKGLYNNFSGSGYGQSSSGSNSKLTFLQPLNLTSIRAKFFAGAMPSPATIYGYDINNNVIASQMIQPNGNYQLLNLNWQAVKSISFDVPFEDFFDPMVGPIPMPQNLYFDELVYSPSTPDITPPVIVCLNDQNICNGDVLPDFTTLINATDNVGIDSIYQVPMNGNPVLNNTAIKVIAVDLAGNKDSCSFWVNVVNPTMSSIVVTSCSNYISPSGKVYTSTMIVSDTIQNSLGCDSIILIDLTIPVIPVPSDPQISQTEICYGDSIQAIANCSSGTILWEVDPMFGSGDEIENQSDTVYLDINQYYRVTCILNSCSSNPKQFTTHGITLNSIPNPPILIASNNSSTICPGEEITIVANNGGCFNSDLVWNDSLTASSLVVTPLATETYTALCMSTESCKSDTSTIEIMVNNFTNDSAFVELVGNPEICGGGMVNLNISGCPNTGYAWLSTGLIVPTTNYSNQVNMNIWENNTQVYVACTKAGLNGWCEGEITDSITLNLTADNLLPPAIPDSNSTYCDKSSFVQFISSSCTQGGLRWERLDVNGQKEFWLISSYSDFDEGDTLVLSCFFEGCYSQSNEVIVDFGIDIPKPIINISQSVFCESEKTLLSTNSCQSPGLSPHWIFHSNGDWTSGEHYYTESIEVTLNSGNAVSLRCGVNNLSTFCETDSSLLIPTFTDNQLISNIVVSDDTLCLGQSFNISYIISEVLPVSNSFEIQLSNKEGWFTELLVIGQGSTANQNNINAVIPSNLEASDKYRIRVVPSETNAGPALYYCYLYENPIVILGEGALSLYNTNSQNCLGSALRLESRSPFFETFFINSGISFYKNDQDISSLNESLRNGQYSKTFGENEDAGLYRAELVYKECNLTTKPVNLTYNVVNPPPLFPDTLIEVYRGQDLVLDGGCASQQVYSENPFSLYSNFPLLKYGNLENILYDKTYYFACKTGDCISDNRKVEVVVADSTNAPEVPILTSTVDSVCSSDPNWVTISASGCTGTVEWAIDSIFQDVYDTDFQAPYEFEVPAGLRVYAVCIENGILSKGIASHIVNTIDTYSYSKPNIKPAILSLSTFEYSLEVRYGADLSLEVDDFTLSPNEPFGIFKYCQNGTINWYNPDSSLIGTGKSIHFPEYNSNNFIYVSCVRNNICSDDFKKVNIILGSPADPKIHPLQSEYAICGSGNALLKATGCIASQVKWFSDSLAVNMIGTGTTFSTPSFSNQGSTNMTEKYYVQCDNGAYQSAIEEITVYISPTPNSPMATDYIASCNTTYVTVPKPQGCSNIEELIWYNGVRRDNEYVYDLINIGIDPNLDFLNKSRAYKVTCSNILSGCESPIEEYALIYDCTPPPPPIISIQNQTTSSVSEKGDSNNDKGTHTSNQFCVGDQVVLNAQNCENGTIFWSDGYVGSPRSYNVKQGYYNLLANCKSNNLVKSTVSNSLEFQSKPTPLFTMVDSVYNTSFVNLTADSVLYNKQFPVGTILNYFSDQAFTNAIPSPNNVTASGTYYAKAIAPNNCAHSEDVIVVIDKCGKVISLVSPLNNHNSGIVTESTRETITAQNKLSNSTRVNYQAEKSILLHQGFEAIPTAGGVILMEIGECEN